MWFIATTHNKGGPSGTWVCSPAIIEPLRSKISGVLPMVIVAIVSSQVLAQPAASRQKDNHPSDEPSKLCETPASDGAGKLSLRERLPIAETSQTSKQSASMSAPGDNNVSDQLGAPAQSIDNAEKGSSAMAPRLSGIPMVIDSGGLITIRPRGASEREVLRAICLHAGIAVDLPTAGLEARMFEDQIGPMPAREALQHVLYGSGLNYMYQSSAADPQIVKRLVVSKAPQCLKDDSSSMTASNGAHKLSDSDTGDPGAYGGIPEQSIADEEPPVSAAPLIPVTGPSPNVPGVPENFNLQEAAAQAHKTPAEMLDELQKRQLEILKSQAPPP